MFKEMQGSEAELAWGSLWTPSYCSYSHVAGSTERQGQLCCVAWEMPDQPLQQGHFPCPCPTVQPGSSQGVCSPQHVGAPMHTQLALCVPHIMTVLLGFAEQSLRGKA